MRIIELDNSNLYATTTNAIFAFQIAVGSEHPLTRLSAFRILPRFFRLLSVLLALATVCLITEAQAAGPYGPTQCAGSRFGSNLGCTANDVSLNSITVAGTPPSSCVGGATLPLNLNVTVNFGSASRYDVGVFLSNNGVDPKLTSASSCSVAVLPLTTPFLNLDGDLCADGNSSINGGTGSGSFVMNGVAVPCTTNGSGSALLNIPYVISWDQQATNYCGDNTYPVPGTSSKCNSGSVTFPAGATIIVLPALTNTDGVTTVIVGNTLTYTVTITNSTASPLSNAVFTDPAVANLSVSSVSCVAAGGATCPASSTVAAMQGSGITLPDMPNTSSLTFTIIATLTAGTAGSTLTNIANVTVSGQTNSASDADTIVNPVPTTTSISPSSVSAGSSSFTMTVNGTNFIPSSVVQIGGVNLTTTYVSATQVTVTIPSSYLTTPGTANITVVNPGPGGGTSNAQVFTVNAAVSSFNAFESSTAATAIIGVIQTKIAGSAFALDVVAISGGAKSTGFTNTVKVELLGNSVTGVSLDAQNCPTSFTVLQTVSPNPTISSGRSTVNFAAVSDAWKDVRVRISYPTTSPTVVSCSTDNFAIRPNSLVVSATDATWITAGTSRALNNSGATGGSVHKAGQPLTITAIAKNAAAVITSNYAGNPSVQTIACTLPTPTCTNGVVTLGTWSASAGTLTSTTASYSEVGAFNLTLQDTTFAAVDAADTPATCAGYYVCSAAVSVGRFVPDHFTLLTNVPKLKTFNTTDAACHNIARTFTYIGQPFGYVTVPQVFVTAQNLANGTTLNYTGNLWKIVTAAGTQDCTTNPNICTLISGGITQTYTYIATPATATAVVAPSWSSSQVVISTPTISGIANGTGTVNSASGDLLAINRSISAPVAPFTANITLTESVIDTAEASNCGVANCDITALAAAVFSPIAFDSGNEFRYGRMRLNNAIGSERLALPVPLTVQYWNGTGWVANTQDNCTQAAVPVTVTTVSPPNPGLSFYPVTTLNNLASGDTTATINNTPFVSGDGALKLSAPSAVGTHYGFVDVVIAAPVYLQFTWVNVAALSNPRARATFGSYYHNGNQFIYQRENY